MAVMVGPEYSIANLHVMCVFAHSGGFFPYFFVRNTDKQAIKATKAGAFWWEKKLHCYESLRRTLLRGNSIVRAKNDLKT